MDIYNIMFFPLSTDETLHPLNLISLFLGQDGTLTHGPNAIISMLHHALGKYTFGEQEIGFHADNAGGKYKIIQTERSIVF